jgi:O-acetyl-ADP-ribose deacetylase (regulator of RNase III)
MPVIELVQSDITTLEVDAIVNAANSALRGGGGVDGAIHRAAGRELLEECLLHPGCPTGAAIRTKGYRLAARFVIHAVGPVWRGGQQGERKLLEAAYESAFRRALEEGTIRTIAFPAISTGIYAFPKDEAARIALTSMRRHEAEFERIVACLFDHDTLRLYTDTLPRL